jgi:hypothetical protein
MRTAATRARCARSAALLSSAAAATAPLMSATSRCTVGGTNPGTTRVRCASIFLDKHGRYIGTSQSQRPPKRTQRTPHPHPAPAAPEPPRAARAPPDAPALPAAPAAAPAPATAAEHAANNTSRPDPLSRRVITRSPQLGLLGRPQFTTAVPQTSCVEDMRCAGDGRPHEHTRNAAAASCAPQQQRRRRRRRAGLTPRPSRARTPRRHSSSPCDSASGGAGSRRSKPSSSPPPPIDAPCTQCLRHGDPMHAQE